MLDAMRALYGLGSMLVWAALVSIPILPTVVVRRGRRERYAMWGARMFAWLCIHATCFAKVTVLGKEHLPAKSGYLVVSNHRSWVDVGLIILHTSSQGISKKEIAYVPFFGVNGYLSGVIFFDRASKLARGRVIEDALFLLRSGANLHVFPEGTRSRDGRLREKVSLRLLQVCAEQGIPVVPACVWGTDQVVPARGFGLNFGEKIGLELSAPLQPGDFPTAEAFAEATWERTRQMATARGANHALRTG